MDYFVQSAAELGRALESFRRAPLDAVDTEAASFHKYVDRIYLIQLSTRSDTVVVDPLAVAPADLAPIGALLADQSIEKIFHDADYDLRTLDRDYGFRAMRMFDTRIAAQLLGEPAIGLGSRGGSARTNRSIAGNACTHARSAASSSNGASNTRIST